MLDAIIYYMPSPVDVPAITGHLADAEETAALARRLERLHTDLRPLVGRHAASQRLANERRVFGNRNDIELEVLHDLAQHRARP